MTHKRSLVQVQYGPLQLSRCICRPTLAIHLAGGVGNNNIQNSVERQKGATFSLRATVGATVLFCASGDRVGMFEYIYFTTVVRRVPPEEGGEIVKLHWPSKSIVAKRPMIATDPTVPNIQKRGGARGGRGIAIVDNQFIVAATYHTLHLFDFELNEVGRITNNLFVGLHEVCLIAGTRKLWVTSTSIDAALLVDLQTCEVVDSVWPRESPVLRELLDLPLREFDKSIDHRLLWHQFALKEDPGHTHLNAVHIDASSGDVLVLLNRFGLIWNATRNEIVARSESLIGGHNLIQVGKMLGVCRTRGKGVQWLDSTTGDIVKQLDLRSVPEINAIHRQASDNDLHMQPLFVRGLTVPDNQHMLVGFSPATIAEIEIEFGTLIDLYQHSTRVNACVHGLACSRS